MPQAAPALINAAIAYASTTGAAAALAAATKAFFITALATVALQALTPKPRLGVVGRDSTANSTVRSSAGPAQWILGRARTPGRLLWWKVDGRVVYLGYALSHGQTGALREMYIEGETVDLYSRPADVRTPEQVAAGAGSIYRAGVGNKYEDQVTVYHYNAANGAQGKEMREAGGNGLAWTANHQLHDVSYVMVRMEQPAIVGGARPLFTRVPHIEFVSDGVFVEVPFVVPTIDGSAGSSIELRGNSTTNAAALRRWWLTTRRGIPANRIDQDAFVAAYTACGLRYLDPVDNMITHQRYEVTGMLFSDDDPSGVEEALDFAMSGHAPIVDGIHMIRPGVDRNQMLILDGADLLTEPTVYPSFDYTSKVNEVTVIVPQSEDHNYVSTTVTVGDTASQAIDGRVLRQSAITAHYVHNAARAEEIAQGYLAEARASVVIRVTAKPTKAGEWSIIALVPGDKVGVYLPQWGFGRLGDDGTVIGDDFLVLENNVQDHLRIELLLREWPPDRFAGTPAPPPA